VDIVGKRNKMRSVPIDSWVKHAVDTYLIGAGITQGALFRAARKGGKLEDRGMTPQAILDMVQSYADRIGLVVRPHDLRRTFAKLAQKGGAEIQQIQFSLGHSSVQTTERYLGTHQDFTTAPSDVLGLRIS
jgi:integrase